MSSRKSGLGRGLEALIPTQPAGGASTGLRSLSLDKIEPNPNQPRTIFSQEALDALAASISEVGVLQPVVVVQSDEGRYQLIAGERRWRAARQVGLESIPAIIRDDDSTTQLTEALIENIQREDLTPLEEAAGYRQLLEEFGLTHEDVGQRVGKSRSAVTNTLRLLQLPLPIQSLLEQGALSAGHARALLGLDDEKFAEHIAQRAASEGWSVREVEEAVRAREGSALPDQSPPRPKAVRPDAIIELEHRLEERLGTNVRIDYGNDRGRVSIKFGSLDELERIYRHLFGSS